MTATLTMGCDSFGSGPEAANHTRVSTLNRTGVRGKDFGPVPSRPDGDAGLRAVKDVLVVVGVLVALWLTFVVVVVVAKPDDTSAKEVLKLFRVADDRHVIRRAGSEKLAEHWPGTPEGLDTLTHVLRLRPASD